MLVEQIIVAVVASAFSGQAIEAPVLSEGMSKPAGIWIDVRTPEEFAQGNLEGAINVPVQVIADNIYNVTTDLNAPIYLYCRSGNRSRKAAEILHQKGYTNIVNYGGFDDLKAKGYK